MDERRREELDRPHVDVSGIAQALGINDATAAKILAELLIIDGRYWQGAYGETLFDHLFASYHAVAQAISLDRCSEHIFQDVIPGIINEYRLEHRWRPHIAFETFKRIMHGPIAEWTGKWRLQQTNDARAAADPPKRRGKPGPPRDTETARKVAEIVRPFGNWRKQLEDVCDALDDAKIKRPKPWLKKGHRYWCTCLASSDGKPLVIKAIQHHLDNAAGQTDKTLG